MKPRPSCFIAALLAATAVTHAADWSSWRGPFQNGVSVEHFTPSEEMKAGKVLVEAPVWTYDSQSRGCPVIADGKVFAFGYLGTKEELVEVLTCLDEKTGKKLWEIQIRDFISDTVYNRYAIGSATVDPATKRVYLLTAYGVFGCWDFDGKEQWRMSMMEKYGRMTFPNSKVGAPAIEGDLVIVRGITANWGADGPAADRFYAFDKMSGELIWASTPGETPPQDSSFSHPVFLTIDGKRVFFSATGCGNIVCANALTGRPLWRHKFAKAGANAAVLLHKGVAVTIHGDENMDTADKGRMLGVKMPTKFNAPVPATPTTAYPDQIIFDPTLDAAAWKSNEVWRHPFGAGSSSPLLVDDMAVQITETGVIVAVDIATGELKWETKVSNGNNHSSPIYADGYVFAPLLEGAVFVLDGKTGKELQKVKVEGNCIGGIALANGHLFVHSTEKLYAFKINGELSKEDSVPAPEMPATGPAVALQVVPAEFAVFPGGKQSFKLRKIDAAGNVVGEATQASWESYIPVTAKVKAKIDDASFNEANEIVANADAKLGAGAFKATDADGLFGVVRGRVMQTPPFEATFSDVELTETFPAETTNPEYKFAYPPLPWIGARFKFQIMDREGEKVFGKSFDRLLFQRGTVFIGTSDMKDYTVQADILTDGNRRSKSDVGVVNQRYAFVLKGNAGQLEVSSNFDRFMRNRPFKVDANKWYTIKTMVKVDADQVNGTVYAKVWERGQPEPDAWTLEEKTSPVHLEGSPGLFGFTPQNQKRVFIDNVKVTPNN
jgi:outer membrane protein assembly factor BamB